MKFFSDFSSCYRPTVQPQPQPQPEEPDSSVHVSLVGGERGTCSRRNRMNGSKYWRPALSVIAEDVVVSFFEQGAQRKVLSEKKASYKTRSTVANKATTAHCYEEFDYYSRKNSMPVVIPAFSPSPFMF